MSNTISDLLHELSLLIDLNLTLDEEGACSILFDQSIEIQMEPDKEEENLLIASMIIDLPPGKFRENILENALRANNDINKIGTLSYLKANNSLTLHDFLPIYELNGQILADYLSVFIDKIERWKNAILSSRPGPAVEIENPFIKK